MPYALVAKKQGQTAEEKRQRGMAEPCFEKIVEVECKSTENSYDSE